MSAVTGKNKMIAICTNAVLQFITLSINLMFVCLGRVTCLLTARTPSVATAAHASRDTRGTASTVKVGSSRIFTNQVRGFFVKKFKDFKKMNLDHFHERSRRISNSTLRPFVHLKLRCCTWEYLEISGAREPIIYRDFC